MIRAAVAYARRLGWYVLPLLVRRKEPNALLVPRGFLDATSDERQIATWWRTAPDANIGIACAASGFFALDVDPRAGGDVELARLVGEHGPLPITATATTGSGGAHYLFRLPRGRLRGKIGAGLDIKAHGYIVVAPSVHPSGGAYRWREDDHPLRTPIADAPAWLLELALVRDADAAPLARGRTPAPPDHVERARLYLEKCEPAVSGQGGHTTTFLVAQKLVRGFALDEATAFSLMTEWNRRCVPPWSRRELARKVKEAARAGLMPDGALLERGRRTG